jgi:hypothetical protein
MYSADIRLTPGCQRRCSASLRARLTRTVGYYGSIVDKIPIVFTWVGKGLIYRLLFLFK